MVCKRGPEEAEPNLQKKRGGEEGEIRVLESRGGNVKTSMRQRMLSISLKLSRN